MNAKHTPGPWYTGMRPGPIIYGKGGAQVADLTADLLPEDERQANRVLIEAAPDMLEALVECVTDYMAAGTGNDTVVKLQRKLRAINDVARAAIHKATGGN